MQYGTANHEEVNGSEEGRDFFFDLTWDQLTIDQSLWEDPTKSVDDIKKFVDDLNKNVCVTKVCPPDRVLTLNGHCDVCPEGLVPIDNNKHCGSQAEADEQAAAAAAAAGPADGAAAGAADGVDAAAGAADAAAPPATRRRLNNEFIMG